MAVTVHDIWFMAGIITPNAITLVIYMLVQCVMCTNCHGVCKCLLDIVKFGGTCFGPVSTITQML